MWSLDIISPNGDDKMPTWLLVFIINGVPSSLLEIPCTKWKCSQIYFIGFKCDLKKNSQTHKQKFKKKNENERLYGHDDSWVISKASVTL